MNIKAITATAALLAVIPPAPAQPSRRQTPSPVLCNWTYSLASDFNPTTGTFQKWGLNVFMELKDPTVKAVQAVALVRIGDAPVAAFTGIALVQPSTGAKYSTLLWIPIEDAPVPTYTVEAIQLIFISSWSTEAMPPPMQERIVMENGK